MMTRVRLMFLWRSRLAQARRHPVLAAIAALPLVFAAVAAYALAVSLAARAAVAAGLPPRWVVAFALSALIVLERP